MEEPKECEDPPQEDMVNEDEEKKEDAKRPEVGNANDEGEENEQKEEGGEEEETVADLLVKAESLYDDDKLLEAGRILKTLDQTQFQSKHFTILRKAKKGEELMDDLKSDFEGEGNGWVIHGVSNSQFPTLTGHRLEKGDDGSLQVKARCETPIDKSLLSPFISVLNETELYQTWLPSWTVPKFRVKKVQKLSQRGRCSQVIVVTFEVPWPIASREVVLCADGFDDINEKGNIGICLNTLDTGDEDGLVPPPEDKSTVRIDVNGGFLIQKCPKDHPALGDQEEGENGNSGDHSDKLLITFAASMNPKMKLLPQSFLNFLVKVAFGICWGMLLKIARDVQNGKRPDHEQAIERKRDSLYDWVDSRIKDLLSFIQIGTLSI